MPVVKVPEGFPVAGERRGHKLCVT
jgi:hypothetical protein